MGVFFSMPQAACKSQWWIVKRNILKLEKIKNQEELKEQLHKQYHTGTTLFWMILNNCPNDLYDLYFKLNPDLDYEDNALHIAQRDRKKYPLTLIFKHLKPSKLESLLVKYPDLVDQAESVVNM